MLKYYSFLKEAFRFWGGLVACSGETEIGDNETHLKQTSVLKQINRGHHNDAKKRI